MSTRQLSGTEILFYLLQIIIKPKVPVQLNNKMNKKLIKIKLTS